MNRPTKKSKSRDSFSTPPTITPLSTQEHVELRSALLQSHEMRSIQSVEDEGMRALLLQRKIDLCLVPINWHQKKKQSMLITNKRRILLELLDFYGKRKFTSLDLLKQSFRLISLNLFRALPDAKAIKTKDSDDMDFREPSWDHLVLIYEIAFHVVTNTEIEKKTMQQFLRGRFLRQLCLLFKSLDDREPQYVKIILHAIYGRFMGLRKEIRGYLTNFCLDYIYNSKCELVNSNESLEWQGIPEVLAIFCSIIQGLNTPVKSDYHSLLRNVLVPLHKSFHVDAFQEELVSCCVQFINKDSAALPVLLGGILKFWPTTSPLKQQLYIDEIVHLVSYAGEGIKCKEMIFCVVKQLCKCMSAPHHQIAERVMLMWKHECMARLLEDNQKCVDLLQQTMTEISQNYWLVDIRNVAKNVMAELQCNNPEIWNFGKALFARKTRTKKSKKLKKKSKKAIKESKKKQRERHSKWERVRQLAVQIHV